MIEYDLRNCQPGDIEVVERWTGRKQTQAGPDGYFKVSVPDKHAEAFEDLIFHFLGFSRNAQP